MVVSKVSMLNNLREERPQTEGFVGRLEVEDKMNRIHFPRLLNEIQATQKLLRNGERCLPNGALTKLGEHPLYDIGYLKDIR